MKNKNVIHFISWCIFTVGWLAITYSFITNEWYKRLISFIFVATIIITPSILWWRKFLTDYFQRRAYRKNLRRFEEIFLAQEGDPASQEANELSKLINDYEDKHYKIR